MLYYPFIVVGLFTASGLLYIPKALQGFGWYGILMLSTCCIFSLSTGMYLGYCWSILQERYAEFKPGHKYWDPFPTLAQKAFGIKMKYVASFCTKFTLFGIALVHLLLCSQISERIVIKEDNENHQLRVVVFLIATVLCYLLSLLNPFEFWTFAARFSERLVFSGYFMLVVAVGIEKTVAKTIPEPTLREFFLSFATFLFSCGGATSFFPFQNHMEIPAQFSAITFASYSFLLLMYFPYAVLTGTIFDGQRLTENVLDALSPCAWCKMTLMVLFMLHSFYVFLLSISELIDEVAGTRTSWKRRFVTIGAVLAIVCSTHFKPDCGKVMRLVGGSSIVFSNYVLTPIFYITLCNRHREPGWIEWRIDFAEKIWLFLIVVVGVLVSCGATYYALLEFEPFYNFLNKDYIVHIFDY